jgi:DNA-binding MarR family transcriptional regulator
MSSEAEAAEVYRDFLCSAHVFATVVRRVFEQETLREAAGDSLTFSQLKLLFFGTTTEGHSISDAAAFLGVSNAAASKMAEKLVRRSMLNRAETQGDRRSSQLALTEASQELLAAYDDARRRKAAEVLSRFELEELLKTADLLDRLAAVIVQHSTAPEEVCLQCEIFYRDRCRYGELSRQPCFYHRHKSNKQELLARPDEQS